MNKSQISPRPFAARAGAGTFAGPGAAYGKQRNKSLFSPTPPLSRSRFLGNVAAGCVGGEEEESEEEMEENQTLFRFVEQDLPCSADLDPDTDNASVISVDSDAPRFDDTDTDPDTAPESVRFDNSCFRFTDHGKARASTRGITEEDIATTMAYGREIYGLRAIIYFIGKKEVQEHGKEIEHCAGIHVILSPDGALITTYRNSELHINQQKRAKEERVCVGKHVKQHLSGKGKSKKKLEQEEAEKEQYGFDHLPAVRREKPSRNQKITDFVANSPKNNHGKRRG